MGIGSLATEATGTCRLALRLGGGASDGAPRAVQRRRHPVAPAAHPAQILASVFILDARVHAAPKTHRAHSHNFGRRALSGSSAYLPAGFSKWPPNWKRIAERSLF